MSARKKDPVKMSDNVMLAYIAGSANRNDWRKLSREERREALEKIAGVADDRIIGAVIVEMEKARGGQKSLF